MSSGPPPIPYNGPPASYGGPPAPYGRDERGSSGPAQRYGGGGGGGGDRREMSPGELYSCFSLYIVSRSLYIISCPYLNNS
jgi:hypothetical protein